MLILRDPSQLVQVEDSYLRALLAQRFQDITFDDYRYDELGFFILAQPGDSIQDLEQAGGIQITSAGFTEARYGEPGFIPAFEVLEAHPGHCFEMVHLLGNDFGVCTIIPEGPGMDPVLLDFCQKYAVPAALAVQQGTPDFYVPDQPDGH